MVSVRRGLLSVTMAALMCGLVSSVKAATNGAEVTISGWVLDSAYAYTKGLEKPIGAECAKACNRAFHHCVSQAAAGKGEHAKMAQIAADCAAFCGLSSEMLSRSSSLALLSCAACADACKNCAQECDSHNSSAEMKTCAEECRRCEDSCRKMVH